MSDARPPPPARSFQLFVKKQPNQTQNERFPTFCQRLEQELFNNARSKVRSIERVPGHLCARSQLTRRPAQEEYLDISSLEQRLQLVARTMASNKSSAQPAAGAVAQAPAVQPALLQGAGANGLGVLPTGATMLAAAQQQLAGVPGAPAPAAGGIGIVPNAAIGGGPDGALGANPTANGLVPADAGAQALLQAQLQQSINVPQAAAAAAGAGAAQVMSNGVPVVRGSRAQGQQQVSAPRTRRATPARAAHGSDAPPARPRRPAPWPTAPRWP
jgi:hypothetical protein